MHAHPYFGSADDSRLASPHFKFAVAPMRQGLLCGSLTRLWIVNRPAFPFGLASLEVLQHHQPLQPPPAQSPIRSEEHTSELQSLMRISYPVFCLQKKITITCLRIHSTPQQLPYKT